MDQPDGRARRRRSAGVRARTAAVVRVRATMGERGTWGGAESCWLVLGRRGGGGARRLPIVMVTMKGATGKGSPPQKNGRPAPPPGYRCSPGGAAAALCARCRRRGGTGWPPWQPGDQKKAPPRAQRRQRRQEAVALETGPVSVSASPHSPDSHQSGPPPCVLPANDRPRVVPRRQLRAGACRPPARRVPVSFSRGYAR